MRVFALLTCLALAACAMPGAPDDATRLEASAGERAEVVPSPNTNKASPAPIAAQPAPVVAPPMSEPLPPERAPDAAKASAPDRSCRTSADCVVKDVGSCCGALPACVNRTARTDPAAVQAQCARQGMSGICGFKEVTGCSCVAGTCQDGAEVAAQ